MLDLLDRITEHSLYYVKVADSSPGGTVRTVSVENDRFRRSVSMTFVSISSKSTIRSYSRVTVLVSQFIMYVALSFKQYLHWYVSATF
jgi:hypothetical protein